MGSPMTDLLAHLKDLHAAATMPCDGLPSTGEALGEFHRAAYNAFPALIAEIERLREIEEMAMQCEGISEVSHELDITAGKLRDWLAARDARMRCEGAVAEWREWPHETGGEYPPDETLVEIYCGNWHSKDRIIGQISNARGVFGPSGASHWRPLPDPPAAAREGVE